MALASGASRSLRRRSPRSAPTPTSAPARSSPTRPPALPPTPPPSPPRPPGTRTSPRRPSPRNSAATIAYIDAHGGDLLHPDFGSPRAYGFPYAVVGAGQRKLPIHYTAYGERERPRAVPGPQRAPRSRAATAATATGTCSSSTARSCTLYELYRAFSKRRRRPLERRLGRRAGTCARPRCRPDSWTSADAAGLPIFPGLVRYDEVAAGHLDHAIRVTFDSTRNAWVHPASHCAGDTSNPNAPAMGTRLRLKAGYGLGGFSGGARVIAEALKRYGMIVADNGSNWYFSGTSDRRWDDENLDQLKRIPGSAFQVVQSAARPHAC